MLLEALAVYPQGSLRIVRTSYSDFFKWACRWGHRDKNPVDLLPSIPEPPTKVYDVFTAAEQAQLIAGRRHAAAAVGSAATRALPARPRHPQRRSARGLQPRDFDTTAKVVVVHGKGDKERMVPFSDELWRAFIAYRNRPIPNVRTRRPCSTRPPAAARHRLLVLPLRREERRRHLDGPAHADVAARPAFLVGASTSIPAAGVRYRSMHMDRHTVGTDLAISRARRVRRSATGSATPTCRPPRCMSTTRGRG